MSEDDDQDRLPFAWKVSGRTLVRGAIWLVVGVLLIGCIVWMAASDVDTLRMLPRSIRLP